MVLEYRFNGRGKLVKGYTYPIKREDMDVALEKAGGQGTPFCRFFLWPQGS